MATDPIFDDFLRVNRERGLALAAASDILDLEPVAGEPTTKYVATFRCPTLVKDERGAVMPGDGAAVGIWFPPDYLRGPVNFYQVLTWLGPLRPFHPNVHAVAPYVCVGRLSPGTDLVSLLHQLYEIVTWMKVAPADAMNEEASQWARNQPPGRFPLDRRPLKRARVTATGGAS